MSSWTYIQGTIRVEPVGETQAQKRYILETILNHLPRVTGSEGDMEIHIIQEEGHNCSKSCDEYGESTNNLMSMYGYKTNRGWLEIQSYYDLMVHAALRDRHFEETYREFMKWLCRLAKRIHIEDILVRISEYDKSVVIDDGIDVESPYYEMYEWPSWCKESEGEPAWWEHLLWERAKGTEYPMLLAYKYIEDPENDAEVERRRQYYKEEN